MAQAKENLNDFINDSIEFQKNCTFQYLMYFDVLIPIEFKTKKNEAIYYRQEIAINNININEELKQLSPEFLKRDNQYDYQNNYDEESDIILNKSESSDGKNINKNLRMSSRNIHITKKSLNRLKK